MVFGNLVTLKHLVPFIALSIHFHAQQYIFAFTSMVSSCYRLNLCLVVQSLSCPNLCRPVDCSHGLQIPLSSTVSGSLLRFMSVE